MSELDRFRQRVAEALRRTERFEQWARGAQPPDHAVLLELVEELRTAMEELQVANEELRAQSDELQSAREIMEVDRLRYRGLFLAAPDAYLVTDALGVIRKANPEAAALLGLGTDRLRGRPLALHVARPARQAFRRELNTLRDTKTVQRLTVKLREYGADGLQVERDIAASVRAVTGPDGSAELCWTLRGVETAAREAERLQELEAGLRSGDPDPIGRASALAATIAGWWSEVAHGIVMVPDAHGHLRSITADDAPMLLFERLHSRLGEGPAFDAYRNGRVVEATDLANDQRYPRFGPAAAAAGIIDVRVYPLFGATNRTPIGVYVRLDAQAGEVGAQLLRGASLLAEVAVTMKEQAQTAADATELTRQLQHALDSRIVIEQAKGKLAERLRCRPDEAFELLRAYARGHNLRLHDLAVRVVDDDIHFERADL